ncbi:MAG: squalene/phytoene synthase family protein [Sphingomonadaceae bacterium]|uniref:squalene/phytoene synthase family protein n=1 Tax=Thermaurantiacus sp. TaxID=2820283 RepID=UPI00298EF746|nr:squalene/phytoene synthase family protein [Thermaurantiacus sp.]MCS6986047.1 squalene/phytoene synthase family protein [Sphingomonadaceae bacterium]MDW8414737.1 squalene/phytoene synthase family protein [Thermaurantiacus sp.]
MARFRDADIEAPSGKGAAHENFLVGSFLVARPLRPHVATYYAFARAADDIADCPHLPAAEKLRRLDAFAAVLEGRATGLSKPEAVRRSLQSLRIPLDRAGNLLVAFRQDAMKSRYTSEDELLAYCRHSAAPVGRFLLDLHGEPPELYPAADALCAALQILNHLQDLKADRQALDRVYLPLEWLDAEGECVEALDRLRTSPGLRRVIDRALELSDRLLRAAGPLARGLRTRSLAAEATAILNLAGRLARRLRHADPLAARVALSPADFAFALAKGAWRSLGGGLGRRAA